jgi:hypothetical protein
MLQCNIDAMVFALDDRRVKTVSPKEMRTRWREGRQIGAGLP